MYSFSNNETKHINVVLRRSHMKEPLIGEIFQPQILSRVRSLIHISNDNHRIENCVFLHVKKNLFHLGPNMNVYDYKLL